VRYFLNLFSPDTAEAFIQNGGTISGFRTRQRNAAERVKPGDLFVCYVTKISRWIGVLRILEGPFEDSTPIFYEANDPFVVRFKVEKVVWMDLESAIPINQDFVWNGLS
jgi:predicted RNA-binding protein